VSRYVGNETFARAMRAKREGGEHAELHARRIREGALIIHIIEGTDRELGVWPTTMGGAKITLGKAGDEGYEQEWMYLEEAMAAHAAGLLVGSILLARDAGKPWPEHAPAGWTRWRHIDGREERREAPPAKPLPGTPPAKCGHCGKEGAMAYGAKHEGRQWVGCSQVCWAQMVAANPMLAVEDLAKVVGALRQPGETDKQLAERIARQHARAGTTTLERLEAIAPPRDDDHDDSGLF